MRAPREVTEARELLADPTSVGEDGKLRPEVHALLDQLADHIGSPAVLAEVRDPSGAVP